MFQPCLTIIVTYQTRHITIDLSKTIEYNEQEITGIISTLMRQTNMENKERLGIKEFNDLARQNGIKVENIYRKNFDGVNSAEKNTCELQLYYKPGKEMKRTKHSIISLVLTSREYLQVLLFSIP